MATVDEVQAMINKQFGRDVLKRGSDPSLVVQYIPTGLLPIDILFQGGVPRGRFTILQGDWSTLKSYIGYKTIMETQIAGGIAGLIDTEHAYDPVWAEAIGIDTKKLLLVEDAETGEEALDAAESMVYAGVDLIVFDSVAAALPQAEHGKRLHKEQNQPGRQAALFSLASRKLTAANSGKTALIWTNQLRENIGMTFGPREKGTGGRALPFYATYICEVRKVGKITNDHRMFTGDKWQTVKHQVGQRFKAELLKSKLNKPFREQWFDWSLSDAQIDMVGYVFAQGVEQGLIGVKGNTYEYSTLRKVGRDKFKEALAHSPQCLVQLTHDIEVMHGLKTAPTVKTGRPKKQVTPAPKKVLSKR